MALVKFGSIITDTRGTIGGHTIKGSAYGVVLQTKPQPPKLRTPKQSRARATFMTYSKKWWSELTPTQRDEWRALAAANPRPNVWGDEFPLTGLALFIGINMLLYNAGLSPTDTAPSDQTVTAPSSATLTISAPATASISFAPSTAPTDHIAYLRATRAQSPGVENPSGRYQFVTASGSGLTSPWNIASALQSLVGTFVAGRKYFISFHFLNTDNGALSAGVVSQAICT